MLTIDKVDAAISSAENVFATQPHQDLMSDLAATADAMVQSGAFTAADVVPGGISAVLPDGSNVALNADRPDLLGYSAGAGLQSSTKGARRISASVLPPPVYPTTGHGVVLLVNDVDTTTAFHPERQVAFAQAFSDAGISDVHVLDTTLENINALAGHPIDFLSIATHGQTHYNRSFLNTIAARHRVALQKTYVEPPWNAYLFKSSTVPTPQNQQQYDNDIQSGDIVYMRSLESNNNPIDPQRTLVTHYGFSSHYLLARVNFNPGGILENDSCYGQYSDTKNSVSKVLSPDIQAAGVGRYLGWSAPVESNDADGTQAYIVDRMLGGSDPSLAPFVAQPNPAQQAFPLDAIQLALQTTLRAGPLVDPEANPHTYGRSPYARATFVASDFGGELTAAPVVEYGLPAISRLQVAEHAATGTLTILGNFPKPRGTVQIALQVPFAPMPLRVVSWQTDHVTTTLPASGPGSAGTVTVFDANGVASNAVQLTQWQGQLTATEHDTFQNLFGRTGTGTGTIVSTYNVDIRSDVHPTVLAVDASPTPQNLFFSLPQGDSTGSITSFQGTFTTTPQAGVPNSQASYSAFPTPPALTLGSPPLTGSMFTLAPVMNQPSQCNNGQAGPQAGPTNVYCPGLGYTAASAGHCLDSTFALCYDPVPASGAFGAGVSGEGLLMLTMDPASYGITVSAVPGSGTSSNFEATNAQETGTVAGSFAAPSFAPILPTPRPVVAPAKLRARVMRSY